METHHTPEDVPMKMSVKKKRHEYHDRELSPAFLGATSPQGKINIRTRSTKPIVGRPPQMASPEIKKMLHKYPDKRDSGEVLTQNRAQVEDLWLKCNDFLSRRPAKQEIVS